jgi:hypothetical protein
MLASSDNKILRERPHIATTAAVSMEPIWPGGIYLDDDDQ